MIDERQLGLFDVPIPKTVAGSLRCDHQIASLLSNALRECDLTRFQVAARMSELTGKEVTKFMLDSWTAEAREGHRFPFEYAAAFEQATESYALTQYLADQRGCKILIGREALDAHLGKLVRRRRELNDEIRRLNAIMGKDGDE